MNLIKLNCTCGLLGLQTSLSRQAKPPEANDVKTTIESALSKAGRNDVTFEVYGFGEDESLSPFDNNLPEGRFYNRTVIIDIIPAN